MSKISENPHIPSKASDAIESAKKTAKVDTIVRDDVPKGARSAPKVSSPTIKDHANRDRFGRNESH